MGRLFSFFLIGLLFSCAEVNNIEEVDENNSINVASWIAGSWEDRTTFKSFSPSKIMYEKWVEYPDSLVGIGGVIVGLDTNIREKLLLKNVSTRLVYIARPENEAMISFSLKFSSNDSLVFENKAHDFPETITYKKITNDSMLIFLRGVSSEQKRELRLSFSRVEF
ncbi:MAG: DUF6265 family protein [Flavobacteriales bacterium]|jgi:hypothetical protein|nr:DUF6265 family protein [Flavobacteriales bacterium]